ncbi:MAG: hypothetical protein KatS3mg087_1319 [Patescibacteria group bacterium]|nr:MAG: hypothetical protein KatS3mg087_1319 [Patescibacteria group bacterium]
MTDAVFDNLMEEGDGLLTNVEDKKEEKEELLVKLYKKWERMYFSSFDKKEYLVYKVKLLVKSHIQILASILECKRATKQVRILEKELARYRKIIENNKTRLPVNFKNLTNKLVEIKEDIEKQVQGLQHKQTELDSREIYKLSLLIEILSAIQYRTTFLKEKIVELLEEQGRYNAQESL